jgi:hypothetical protein
VKGCGEVGAIGSPPAVINAVVDALKDYGRRLPGRGAGARGHHPHRPARDRGRRLLRVGMFETALKPGELITKIAFPVPQKAAT